MELNEAIYTTRAMRRMKADPVPEDVLRRLFDAAVRAPSSGNQQKVRFLIVSDPGMKAAIQPIYRECLDELNRTTYADVQASIESRPDDPKVVASKRIDSSAQWFADNLHHSPLLIFVFGKQGGETSTFPALWNLCLAARAEGLGTAITTLLKIQKRRVEEMLGVPDDGVWHMHGMIPLGYPTGRWGLAKREPAHLSVFQETWDRPVSWEVPDPLWAGAE
jgi:nitroreductase